ncbi:alpha-1,3-mannosyl-glycoprotein 2-beta-N-acetylglucosaminyltransferase-like [Physella acuta]|uniref:alpha-1,3-mannosyl-glycoprotein 2-beta-N-acetylglucosaminyltransferase-like n=1 Tax=Physella acuta TaxID=109671 RepID=UPI0027DD8541|nr:alpha-1,3-mannosyl-glycoprotein 2-beta-N-acetylglucosaminyltransferase-like [Physella acuta]
MLWKFRLKPTKSTLFVLLVVLLTVVVWNFLTYRSFNRRHFDQIREKEAYFISKLSHLERDIKEEVTANAELLDRLRKANPFINLPKGKEGVFPVLVIACNRVSVNRALDKLLEYRVNATKFPIVVSQDCAHEDTAKVILQYVTSHNISLVKQPDTSEIAVPKAHSKLVSYYKVARHFRWALELMFVHLDFNAVIIVEDDIEIAPDFYEYFSATYPLLHADPSLYCISAWSDNGMEGKVSGEPGRLYRTDFFPGLGWMLEKSLWLELRETWPATFWDDWLRAPDQRKGRQCIRPEISRTKTFGSKGVSNGAYYTKYLQHIKLNTEFVPFTLLNLSYLEQVTYNQTFTSQVYSAPLHEDPDVVFHPLANNDTAVRFEYSDKPRFVKLAGTFGVMEDFKAGVARTAYNGVVTFMHKGKRVYLAPPPNWGGYNVSWY